MVAIKELDNASDLYDLQNLLLEEEHPMVNPTHCIKRDGIVTGGLGIGGCIPVQFFLSKKHENFLDILTIKRYITDYCKRNGQRNIVLQIGPESPGYKIMQKLGATYIGLGHYWHYDVQKD